MHLFLQHVKQDRLVLTVARLVHAKKATRTRAMLIQVHARVKLDGQEVTVALISMNAQTIQIRIIVLKTLTV
jgi:endonuclease V-like protein UPF0215 family